MATSKASGPTGPAGPKGPSSASPPKASAQFKSSVSPDATGTHPFIDGVLKGIGAPITANTVTAMQEWLAAEGGSNYNFLNTKMAGGTPGPNGIQSYPSLEAGIQATVATIRGSNMSGILHALQTNSSPDQIKAAVISSPWDANHYRGTDYGGGTGTAASLAEQAQLPGQTFAAPQGHADLKNFHGYDLSAFAGTNELGNAEKAILDFNNPQARDKNGLTLADRITQDFGYTGSWVLKNPELGAVAIWAAQNADASTAAGKAQFLSFLQKTNWYQTTSQNQRAWQEANVTDHASATAALQQAQDKVFATANQLGVKLTAAQTNRIANMYAEQSYTPTNVLGAQSGTSQEWLDQAVVDTVMNIKHTGKLTPGGAAYNQDFAGGVTDLSTATSPTQFQPGGIASQLYQKLQGIAQDYLLYNPENPQAGLLTQQDLMKEVTQALQGYTGSGSFGSSNLINGAAATFEQKAIAQAKSMYPTLASAIDAGSRPSSYIAPLTNYVASQTGMSSGQINVLDPQWNWIISSTDPKTGIKAPVTQDQALQKITDPGFSWTDPNGQQMTYLQTNNGQQMQNQFSQQFEAAFGKVA